jgi:uncharacterized protein (UPF0548 family)
VFLHRRPSADQVQRFLTGSVSSPLSYAPMGIAKEAPAGSASTRPAPPSAAARRILPRPVNALIAWKHFDLGWLEVFPRRSPMVVGTLVVALVRHLGFWSLNACRIVYLIDEDHDSSGSRKFGFAYGTPRNHAGQGEEIFTVSHHLDTDDVRYEIRAVSRPRAPLARLGYPIYPRAPGPLPPRLDSSHAGNVTV